MMIGVAQVIGMSRPEVFFSAVRRPQGLGPRLDWEEL